MMISPKSFLKHVILAGVSFAVLGPAVGFAGIAVYTGDSGEKLFIQDAPSAGSNVAMIKFEGIESPWAGKVIQVDRSKSARGDRYGFEYDLGISGPKQMRHYEIVVESGSKMLNGTSAKTVDLYVQGKRGPIKMVHDREQTMASQKLDLVAERKKSPFTPEVD